MLEPQGDNVELKAYAKDTDIDIDLADERAETLAGAHQVEAYLGLVPRELSSGEKQRKGRITKTGDRRTRCLLVEAAWALLRSQRPAVAPLRAWTERLAARRGRRVAVVALARKLAGILYAMMRDETEFNDKYWTVEKQGM